MQTHSVINLFGWRWVFESGYNVILINLPLGDIIYNTVLTEFNTGFESTTQTVLYIDFILVGFQTVRCSRAASIGVLWPHCATQTLSENNKKRKKGWELCLH